MYLKIPSFLTMSKKKVQLYRTRTSSASTRDFIIDDLKVSRALEGSTDKLPVGV